VAIPPPLASAVVQSVLPVEAKITVPMPKPHVTVVKVAAETNSMTATIGH
jgi:hypothetical protein